MCCAPVFRHLVVFCSCCASMSIHLKTRQSCESLTLTSTFHRRTPHTPSFMSSSVSVKTCCVFVVTEELWDGMVMRWKWWRWGEKDVPRHLFAMRVSCSASKLRPILIENCNFFMPHLYVMPHLRVNPMEFCHSICRQHSQQTRITGHI